MSVCQRNSCSVGSQFSLCTRVCWYRMRAFVLLRMEALRSVFCSIRGITVYSLRSFLPISMLLPREKILSNIYLIGYEKTHETHRKYCNSEIRLLNCFKNVATTCGVEKEIQKDIRKETKKGCAEYETCEQESTKDAYFQTGQTFLQSSAQVSDFHDDLKKEIQKENTAPTRASPFESIFSAQMSDTVPFELGPEHLHFHRMSANSFSSIKRLCFPERRDRIYIREIQDTLEHRHYRNISIPSMMARQNLPQGNPGHAGTQK